MKISSTHLEDVCAILGWQVTTRLVGWRGGKSLYIPTNPTINHELTAVFCPDDKEYGLVLLKRLSAEYGGETIQIAGGTGWLDKMRRMAKIRELLSKNVPIEDIAKILHQTKESVCRQWHWLTENGMIKDRLIYNNRHAGESQTTLTAYQLPLDLPLPCHSRSKTLTTSKRPSPAENS